MWKIASKQIIYNWKILLGTIISIFLSTVFLSTFSLLLINSIYYIVDAKKLHAENPILPVSLFGALVGISFFLGLFSIYSTVNLSVKLRWNFFVKLRIIGLTFNKIRLLILLENFFISIVNIIISLFLGVVFAKLIINFFKEHNQIDPMFNIFSNYNYQWIYILSTIIFVLLIVWMAILPLKKINIKDDQNPFQHEKWLKVTFKFIFGLTSLAGALALSTIKEIQIGGMGVGMDILAVFLYTTFFCLCGKYLLLALIQMLYFLTKKIIIFKLMFKYIKSNIFKIMLPIALLIITNLFVNFATNTTNFISNNSENAISSNVMLILLIELGLMTIFISINTIIQYFFYQKEDIIKWRILGMTSFQKYMYIFFQGLFIGITTVIFSLPVNLFLNYMFIKFNHLDIVLTNNAPIFIGINVAIIIFCIIVSMFSILFINKLKK